MINNTFLAADRKRLASKKPVWSSSSRCTQNCCGGDRPHEIHLSCGSVAEGGYFHCLSSLSFSPDLGSWEGFSYCAVIRIFNGSCVPSRRRKRGTRFMDSRDSVSEVDGWRRRNGMGSKCGRAELGRIGFEPPHPTSFWTVYPMVR